MALSCRQLTNYISNQISTEIISRGFIRGSHQFRKLGIWLGKKSSRRIKLHDFAIAHDKNTIARDNCLQPMSDHKYSTVRELVL